MPPYSSETNLQHGDRPSMTGFSADLMKIISLSRTNIENWAENEKKKADEASAAYHEALREQQEMIDSQAAALMVIQKQRGLNVRADDAGAGPSNTSESIAEKKKSLELEIGSLEADIARLEKEKTQREKRVKDVEAEERKQRARAEEVHALQERVKEAKQTTVDDLTRGILNYKQLGLDFQKTDVENELRFFFSQIDPSDPDRQFSFVLQVDIDDRYEIAQCEPSVDSLILLEIAEHLNKTDDMSYLARHMRRAFVSTL